MTRLLPALLMGGALLAAPALSPLTASRAAAAEPTESEVDYGLTFDAAGLFASPAGRLLMDRVRQQEPQLDDWVAGLTDSLGLDVTTDLGVVSLTSDRDDLSDLTLMADLGETSGKLEGWMLTLPGYDSEDLDDETLLHGFDVELDGNAPDDGTLRSVQEDGTAAPQPRRTVRVFAAIPQTRGGRHCLVASTQRAQTLTMAGDVAADRNPLTEATDRLPGDRLLSLSLGRLPAQLLEDTADQPGAAAWRAVRGLQIDVASGERFRTDIAVAASTAARGRQLKQLLGGLGAVVQLMASGDDNAAVGEAAGILSELSLDDRADGEPGLELSLDIPQSRLEGWVDRGLIPAMR